MRFPYGETVYRLRRELIANSYSSEDDLGAWSDAVEQPIEDCAIVPGGAVTGSRNPEPTREGRAETVVTDYAVYTPPGADVTPYDRLRVRGRVCEVVGRPADWRNPLTGWAPGLVVSVNVVEG
jgi:hypothetical protein